MVENHFCLLFTEPIWNGFWNKTSVLKFQGTLTLKLRKLRSRSHYNGPGKDPCPIKSWPCCRSLLPSHLHSAQPINRTALNDNLIEPVSPGPCTNTGKLSEGYLINFWKWAFTFSLLYTQERTESVSGLLDPLNWKSASFFILATPVNHPRSQ